MVAIGFVSTRIYALWQKGPWDLPKPGKGKEAASADEPKAAPRPQQLASTKNIVEKNLFDPERGAGRMLEAEASSAATQRIRSMILLGTAILGSSRYAILQQPSDARSPAPGAPAGQQGSLRLKLGDTVEGFKLSEIHDKRVVFTKGASRVEVALDFFRKVDQTKQSPPGAVPARPGVAPGIPRRENLPAPPVAP